MENNKPENIKCRMISIDSSTKKTAYALYENGEYQSSDLIDLEDIGDIEVRFSVMAKKILNVLENQNPDIIYIEDTVVTRNAQTQRFLTRLQGVVYGYCISHDCEFNAIRPTTWRKIVGIRQYRMKREQLKEKAVQMVEDAFEINVNDDEAEAILIGLAAIKKFDNMEKKLKKAR